MVGDVSSSMEAGAAFEELDVVGLADEREAGALVERGACFKFEFDRGGLQ